MLLTKDQWTPNSLVVGELSQASSKADDDRQTPLDAPDDLGQLASGTKLYKVCEVTGDLC